MHRNLHFNHRLFLYLLLMILPAVGWAQTVTIAGWDVSGQTGYGASPLSATTANANVTVTGLTRGSGVSTSGTAASRAWGGASWSTTTAETAITDTKFATFSVKPNTGYTLSITSISQFDYRRSSTGPASGLVQYQINDDSFVDITTVSFTSTSSSGAAAGSIDLSSIAALQNIPATSTVTFRIVPYGATGTGTWYIFDKDNSTALDFTVSGTMTIVGQPTNPTVNLSVSPNTASEADQTEVTVTAMASAPVTGDQTVNLAVSGTGIIADDYSLSGTTITIPDGASSGTVTFSIVDDSEAEGEETATLTISNPSLGITLGSTVSQNVVIADNDAAVPAGANVVISQVYGGGNNTNAPYRNDFVELYNRSSSSVSLSGWSVQYTSATGTGNFGSNKVDLSGAIAPGQYYLIRLAGGTTNGVELPAADASGSINMSATGGKVILANTTTGLPCNGGSTPCAPAELAQIVDLVGFGSANFYEGSGAAPAPSNTTSAVRKANGATDTNDNSADFVTGAPNPRNSAQPTSPTLTATPTSLTGGNALYYVEGSGPDSKTFSVSGTLLTTGPGTITVTSSNPAVFSVSPAQIDYTGTDLTATTVTVQLVAGLTPGPYPGTITLNGGGASLEVPVSGIVNSNSPFTPISIARAAVGQTFTIQGRVTVTNQLGSRQIYIQDETGGIVVYSGPSGPDFTTLVELGDLVEVTGPISVFNGFTEITGTGNFTVVEGVEKSIPEPQTITLNQLADYQGQLVKVLDATITPVAATFAGNSNYTIAAAGQTGTMRINANSPLGGAGQPANPVAYVVGIADRFVSGATTPGTNGLQLQPRLLEDIPGATAAQDQLCTVPGPVSTLTLDQTLDIATWNMEFFGADAGTITCPTGTLNYNDMGPTNEDLQQTNAITVLNKLNADIIAVQEMSDVNRLAATVAALPGSYSYICSDRFSYYFQDECDQVPSGNPPTVFGPTSLAQKVCVIYNTATVTPLLNETKALLDGVYNYPDGNGWSSGRLPFLFVADATIDGVTRRIHVVDIHAKSGSATADYNRRQQDILDLKAVLDSQYPEANLILLGDYNDKLNGSIAAGQPSSYQSLVNDVANYTPLTLPLENQNCTTFNSSASFIDHMIVSSELNAAYVTNSAYVIQPFSIPNYGNTTSDHNPVVARFDISQLPAPVTPLEATVTASPDAILTNQTTSLTAAVTGGTTPYTYEWTGPGIITNADQATATVSGLTPGLQTFTVKITDATLPVNQTLTKTVDVMVTQANREPVATTIPDQTATAGESFSLDISTAFSDADNDMLTYTATGLPAGLTLTDGVISGVPTTVEITSVTVTATDPGTLSASTSFTFTVLEGLFKMLDPTYNCEAGLLTVNTIAGNGNPIEYQIPSVSNGWESKATYAIEAKHIGKELKIRARQRASDGHGYVEVEISFTPTACAANSRLGLPETERLTELTLTVLGNPVSSEVTFELRGAEGQPVQLRLMDMQGRILDARSLEAATAVEQHTFDVQRQASGILLLQATTPSQQKVVKVLKR